MRPEESKERGGCQTDQPGQKEQYNVNVHTDRRQCYRDGDLVAIAQDHVFDSCAGPDVEQDAVGFDSAVKSLPVDAQQHVAHANAGAVGGAAFCNSFDGDADAAIVKIVLVGSGGNDAAKVENAVN